MAAELIFVKSACSPAARSAILYAFDLIEHDGDDVRELPFLDRKNALARLLRDTNAGILLNEHVAEDGPTVFAHACRFRAEGIVSKKVDGTYRSGPCPAWVKVRNPASIAVQRERSEMWNRWFVVGRLLDAFHKESTTLEEGQREEVTSTAP